MAFINNTPMVVGGSTPTPTGKKYNTIKRDLFCSVSYTSSSDTLMIVIPDIIFNRGTYRNLAEFMRINLVPGNMFFLIKDNGVDNSEAHQYGLLVSGPTNSNYTKDGTIILQLQSCESMKVDQSGNISFESVRFSNAVAQQGLAIIIEDYKKNCVFLKKIYDTKGVYTVKYMAYATDPTQIAVRFQYMDIEESEE